MRISRHIVVLASIMMVAFVSLVAVAQAEEAMMGAHHGFSGVISKIESGVLFVKTPDNLQPRPISPNKADRVGLHEAKKGDAVLMLVDSGNVLLDVTEAGQAFADHRMIVGNASLCRSLLERDSDFDAGGIRTLRRGCSRGQ